MHPQRQCVYWVPESRSDLILRQCNVGLEQLVALSDFRFGGGKANSQQQSSAAARSLFAAIGCICLQECISHCICKDTIMLNLWQVYNTVTEAATKVGFKSSILDMAQLREQQAGELLVLKEALSQSQGDTSNLQKTLAMITGASLFELFNHHCFFSDHDINC
jgi:hypothetical protein